MTQIISKLKIYDEGDFEYYEYSTYTSNDLRGIRMYSIEVTKMRHSSDWIGKISILPKTNTSQDYQWIPFLELNFGELQDTKKRKSLPLYKKDPNHSKAKRWCFTVFQKSRKKLHEILGDAYWYDRDSELRR